MKRKIAVLIMLSMLTFMGNISFAETVEGKTIRLESYTGNVLVTSATGREVKIINKMRVFDGYTVTTQSESNVYLSLDSKKSIKLDQNTKVSIVKKDKINEIQVISGAIFFSVTEKLAENESLDVVTPTMAIGIRGTTGTVRVIKEESFAQLYSGMVMVRNNRGNERLVQPGEQVRESEIREKNLEVAKLDISGSDIPSFSLAEINTNPEVKQQIKEENVFKIEKFEEAEKINKDKETEEIKEQLKQIEADKKVAEEEKITNTIDRTNETITVSSESTFGTENKVLEYIRLGETKEFTDYEGDVYILEVDENTGIANFVEKTEFDEDVKIENSKEGNIKLSVGDESTNLGGSEYQAGYTIIGE